MPRTTAALFVATIESGILTVVAFAAFSAIMAGSADRSPLVAWSYELQFALFLTTVVVQLVLMAADKSSIITDKGAAPSAVVEKVTELAEQLRSERASEYDRMSVLKQIAESASGGSARRMFSPLLMSKVTGAYSSSVFMLLATLAFYVLQSTSFGGSLDSAEVRQRVSGTGNQTSSYAATERLDWVQATVGGSGWDRTSPAGQSPSLFSVSGNGSDIPILGSVYAGLVLGYLGVSLVLSLYVTYSATPEGAQATIFTDPRSLNILNGFLMFSSRDAVNQIFGRCASPIGPSVGISAYAAIVCFDSAAVLLFSLAVDAIAGPGQNVYRRYYTHSMFKPIWETLLSCAPFFVGIFLGRASTFLVVLSLLTTALAVALVWIEFFFRVLPDTDRNDFTLLSVLFDLLGGGGDGDDENSGGEPNLSVAPAAPASLPPDQSPQRRTGEGPLSATGGTLAQQPSMFTVPSMAHLTGHESVLMAKPGRYTA